VLRCGSLWLGCVHHESGPVPCLPVSRSADRWWLVGLVGVGGGVGVGLVVCVTSCEGHMVDALASRADEGRRSLR
jgi:hypothetical protein